MKATFTAYLDGTETVAVREGTNHVAFDIVDGALRLVLDDYHSPERNAAWLRELAAQALNLAAKTEERTMIGSALEVPA